MGYDDHLLLCSIHILQLGTSVRLDSAWLSQYLTTLDVFTLGTTQQDTTVLARTTFVEQFTEHFNTSTQSVCNGVFDTNDFNFFTDFDDTAILHDQLPQYHDQRSRIRLRLASRMLCRSHALALECSCQGFQPVAILLVRRNGPSSPFNACKRRTTDDWGVVTWEIVFA
jgi:hypothetical protein